VSALARTAGIRLALGIALAIAAACGSAQPPRLAADSVLGLHVGMKRRELAQSFTPRGEGKWYELESVAGENRLRWAVTGEGSPQSVDVRIEHGRVSELVFSLRAEDGRAALAALGAPEPRTLTRFSGPNGQVVVAPGPLGWTIRLLAR